MKEELEHLREEAARLSRDLGAGAGEQPGELAADLDKLASQAALPSQSEETARRGRRDKLLELSAAPISSVQDVLEHAARITAEGLGADFTKVLELLPDGELLVRAGYGWPPGVVGRTRDAAGTGSQAGFTMVAGEPVVIEDLGAVTRFSVPEVIRRSGVVSSATVPIPGKYRPYGVLEADSKRRRTYGEPDIRFLKVAANVIGSAISLVRAERALHLQHGLSLAFAGAGGDRDAVVQSLRALGEALDFQMVSIWRPDPGDEEMRCHAVWMAPTFQRLYPGYDQAFHRGEGMVGLAWEQRQVQWSSRVADDPRSLRREALAGLGVASGVCFPVWVRDAIVAVVELLKDEPFEPDAEMLATLQAVAHQLGGFLERSRTDRLLRTREREFRAAIENSPDPIGRYGRDMQRLYMNPVMERLAWLTPGGGPTGEGFPAHAIDDWKEAARRAFETGREQTAEVEVPDADGVRVFQSRIVPEFGEDGSVASILSIGRDVTDLKRAEETARHRYEQLRALVEAAPIGMIVADADTRTIMLSNREYERLVGRRRRAGDPLDGSPRAVVARRPDGSVIDPGDLPLRRALDRGAFVHAEEITVEHSDGAVFPTVNTAAPVLDREGNVVAAILVIQDITPLRQLDRLRSDILGMAGHELRTPLAIIRLAASSLLTDPAELAVAEVAETLQTIDAQAVRMTEMVSNMRDMAQIDAGAFSLQKEPGDLREVLEEARDDMAKTGVENIVMRVPEGLSKVPMDRLRVLQVVENLLSNAFKYGTPGAPIEVEARQDDGAVTVSVRNQGPGIPKERQPLLFQKFSRLGRARGEAGSGLGLAICKGIVQAHRGRIWVESSASARFTIFSFTLPLEPAAVQAPGTAGQAGAAADATPDKAAGHPPHGRERVLIVEHEPHALQHLKRVLERSGYDALTAEGPAAAVEAVRREHPGVVLVDVALPGAAGFDAFERIRSYGVPAIFMGERAAEDRERARRLGAEAYLTKPVHAGELVSRVRAALEKRGAARS